MISLGAMLDFANAIDKPRPLLSTMRSSVVAATEPALVDKLLVVLVCVPTVELVTSTLNVQLLPPPIR